MNNPEVTQQALSILRSGENFQWYIMLGLAVVAYVYTTEMKNGNWKVVAAGFSYYMVHWFVEIVNGLIQHFTGHALWTVPFGTGFLLLIGVGAELSIMFMISGLALSKLLPEDPKLKILRDRSRSFIQGCPKLAPRWAIWPNQPRGSPVDFPFVDGLDA